MKNLDQDEAYVRDVMAALHEEDDLLEESHRRVEMRAMGLGADEMELLQEEGLSLVELDADFSFIDLDVRREPRRLAA